MAQAYGLSKTTVALEKEDGPTEYNSLKFVEFLEMIGRIAYLKWETSKSSLPMEKKIFIVLEALLEPIGLSPSLPSAEDSASETETDDDY